MEAEECEGKREEGCTGKAWPSDREGSVGDLSLEAGGFGREDLLRRGLRGGIEAQLADGRGF